MASVDFLSDVNTVFVKVSVLIKLDLATIFGGLG